MIRRIFLLFLIIFSISCYGQEPVSVNLSEKDGLPDKEFYDIIEDSKGFIWLCADKGLFRYDGNFFETYTNTEKRGLSVFGVKEDSKGRIWCNNISGQFFYVKNDKLHLFIDLKTKLKGELASFLVRDNTLIVFTNTSIFTVSLDEQKSITDIDNGRIIGEPFIDNNVIYYTNGYNLNKLNPEVQKSLVFKSEKTDIRDNGRGIITGKSRVFKHNGNYIVSFKEYFDTVFYEFDIQNKTYKKIDVFNALIQQQIQHIKKEKNRLWFSTTNGIWVYTIKGPKIAFEKHILKTNNASKILKDKSDNYWTTTLNSGIYVFPNIYIERYDISSKNTNITSFDIVENKQFIFGSHNGYFGLYDIKTNTTTSIKASNSDKISVLKYNPNSHKSYISTDKKLFIYNHQNKDLFDYTSSRINITGTMNVAKQFVIIDDQSVICANYASLYLFQDKDVYNGKYISERRRPYTLHHNKNENAVYVAYVDALVKYDSLWKPKNIDFNNKSIYGLTISETLDNTIWIGTFKNGVFGIKNNRVVKHLTVSNGLISNYIEVIKADQNMLWIATDKGIQRYNTKTKTFETLTKRDGITSYDVTNIEVLGDKIVFSSSDGLFSIDKEKAFKQQKPAKVYFNQISINNKAKEIKDKYSLNYNENSIKIGFNVNGFQFNQKGRYEYKLDRFNKDWVTTDTGINSVTFNNLQAGNYTFTVKPIIENSTGQAKERQLTFTISQAFWKTWWFKIFAFGLLISTIIFYFKIKTSKNEAQRQKELQKLEIENQLVNVKLENLRSQMNPHFIFNALNSIQDYIVANEKKIAVKFLVKFSRLIRIYLEHSQEETITLQEEIEALDLYLALERNRFDDALEYNIDIENTINSSSISVPSLFIQPYVENAIKHGLLHKKGKKKLDVNFAYSDDKSQLICNVIDNGIGRSKSKIINRKQEYKSYATSANLNRVDLLNTKTQKQMLVQTQDLYTKTNESAGTKVIITIPLK